MKRGNKFDDEIYKDLCNRAYFGLFTSKAPYTIELTYNKTSPLPVLQLIINNHIYVSTAMYEDELNEICEILLKLVWNIKYDNG